MTIINSTINYSHVETISQAQEKSTVRAKEILFIAEQNLLWNCHSGHPSMKIFSHPQLISWPPHAGHRSASQSQWCRGPKSALQSWHQVVSDRPSSKSPGAPTLMRSNTLPFAWSFGMVHPLAFIMSLCRNMSLFFGYCTYLRKNMCRKHRKYQ